MSYIASEMENPDSVDPTEYIRKKEEYEDKREDFMRKHLRRSWPIRIVRILGVFQLAISLAILGVDLPIVLMFAPRWQVFAGCWTFVFGFVACVSTLHSSRKMTWLKLKWAVGFNILAGVAAALMTGFDILYLVNPNICLIASGCNYLWYTFSIASSYYAGEVFLGIAFLFTTFIFLVLFIKYGVGGLTLFENILNGREPATFNPIVPPHGAIPATPNPATGRGIFMAAKRPRAPPPPPPLSTMPRYPPPAPGAMMLRPPGPMMMQGPQGPMMVHGPQGPMMVPRPNSPLQGYYRQPGPYPSSAQRYQS